MARASATKARKTGRQGRAKTTAATGRYLGAAVASSHRYCAARFPKARRFAPGVAAGRARLIRQSADKWMNGSTLRYWFFDKPKKWGAAEAQKDVVRAAFASWKALGIGLDFVEVERRADADLRIAFQIGDGSWSYIGTDVRTPREDPRTMNFGWDLLEDPQEGMDTALHEIGHTLGFPHEHQNPFAGIVWNEAAVYAAMKGEPNYWDRATTFQNIIEKIVPDSVQGSDWDPDSVMHYPFDPGMIDQPARYRDGLVPAGGLSARDRQWALKFYPGMAGRPPRALVPLETAALDLGPAEQADFIFVPDQDREYEFRTFGTADTAMALYAPGAPGAPGAQGETVLAADDDSGTERNAYLKLRLRAGEHYLLRVRMQFEDAAGRTAVMVW